jgi:hypothetical protein
MHEDAEFMQDALETPDNMMLDKENYKRNLHGTLRDENGHKQRLLCEDELALVDNQNNCTNCATNILGNRHP